MKGWVRTNIELLRYNPYIIVKLKKYYLISTSSDPKYPDLNFFLACEGCGINHQTQ